MAEVLNVFNQSAVAHFLAETHHSIESMKREEAAVQQSMRDVEVKFGDPHSTDERGVGGVAVKGRLHREPRTKGNNVKP